MLEMGCYHGLTRERAIRKETSLVASFHGRRKCNFYLVLFCNLLTFIGSIYGEIVVPGTVSNFIYKGNSNRVAHIAHKQASRALDWCLFVPWTPRLKQKWKSQVAASWWLSLTDCVGTWTAWEGTEQCPYLSRASPCLHFPVCKRLAMIPTLFFRDSFFFFWKAFWPLLLKRARHFFVIDPGAWDESRLPPRTRLPSSGRGELVLLEVRDRLTCLHPGLLK